MLRIGEFSKLSRISIRMLRHYDEIGLLTPSAIDPETAYRYYSEHQLPIAARIVALRDMGFSLADTARMMGCDTQAMDRFLQARQHELTIEATELQRKLLLVSTARRALKDGATEKDGWIMDYNVTLKTLPERYVASVRMKLPRYEQEGMLWSVLMSETMPLGVVADDPCYMSVTYHDGEFKETDVDCEAQKTIKGHYADTEHVRFKTVPAVTFASVVFKGPYSKISAANAAVAGWVRDNGYIFDAPAFNIYHVSPHETQNPNEFVTEVCYPVSKR